MKKFLFRAFVLLWVAVMVLLGLYYLLLSPRESSFDESENRALAAAPALTAETVFGGGRTGWPTMCRCGARSSASASGCATG